MVYHDIGSGDSAAPEMTSPLFGGNQNPSLAKWTVEELYDDI